MDDEFFIDPDEAPEPPSAEPDAFPPGPVEEFLTDKAEEERGVPSAIPGLVRASDLIEDEDRDQGDFEPGGLYKGFKICTGGDRPQIDAHSHLHRRFYVETPDGTAGLVPWEGSQIIWPWEAAWSQDLYRPEVESLLKDEPKKKKGER